MKPLRFLGFPRYPHLPSATVLYINSYAKAFSLPSFATTQGRNYVVYVVHLPSLSLSSSLSSPKVISLVSIVLTSICRISFSIDFNRFGSLFIVSILAIIGFCCRISDVWIWFWLCSLIDTNLSCRSVDSSFSIHICFAFVGCEFRSYVVCFHVIMIRTWYWLLMCMTTLSPVTVTYPGLRVLGLV